MRLVRGSKLVVELKTSPISSKREEFDLPPEWKEPSSDQSGTAAYTALAKHFAEVVRPKFFIEMRLKLEKAIEARTDSGSMYSHTYKITDRYGRVIGFQIENLTEPYDTSQRYIYRAMIHDGYFTIEAIDFAKSNKVATSTKPFSAFFPWDPIFNAEGRPSISEDIYPELKSLVDAYKYVHHGVTHLRDLSLWSFGHHHGRDPRRWDYTRRNFQPLDYVRDWDSPSGRLLVLTTGEDGKMPPALGRVIKEEWAAGEQLGGGFGKALLVELADGRVIPTYARHVIPIFRYMLEVEIDPVTLQRIVYKPGDIVYDRSSGQRYEINTTGNVDNGPKEGGGFSGVYSVIPLQSGSIRDVVVKLESRDMIPERYYSWRLRN